MSLEAVCIEVRRKLQCANIYLTFDRTFKQCQNSVKIRLNSNKILVEYDSDDTVIDLSPHFSIEPYSISALVVEGNNVSFRVVLCNETGSLDMVFDDDDNDKNEDEEKPKQLPKEIIVSVSKDRDYQLKCSNCENTLLHERKRFARVLELPSEFVDMSEWFCHKHDHAGHDLTPKEDDVFFGLYFIVINFKNVCNVISREQFIYCKRCLKFLGEKVYADNALKLWNDSACLDEDGRSQKLFEENDENCVFNVVNRILNENMIISKLHSMQFVKILFEAVFPNRKQNYLMLTVLEQNVEILANFQVNGSDEIDLENRKALQVLFKGEDSPGQPLVVFWRNDLNVQNVTISYQMYSTFLKLLDDNSKLVPEMYRYNNGFCRSYYFTKANAQ